MSEGRVAQVIGPVVDVEFEPGKLPALMNALVIHQEIKTARGTEMIDTVLEVAQHLGREHGAHRLDEAHRGHGARHDRQRHRRADLHAGRARGARPHPQRRRRARGHHGPARRQEARPDPPPGPGPHRAGHLDPDVRDRHQGHRPAGALHEGRQDRPLRRRGRRQDRAHHGADQQRRDEPRRLLGLRRRRRAHPRGQRPVPRVRRVQGHQPRREVLRALEGQRRFRPDQGRPGRARQEQGRADLRPDDRAARRAPARRPDRPDRRRGLPRRRGHGRAALHRQHLPLHAGRLRSLGAARAHALRGRLPADARDRDGRAAGAHHLDPQGLGHLACRRSTCRPTT